MNTKILLIVLVCIAFFLRFFLLPQNLFFGPEQGRDFLVIRDIAINYKLTLIGPKTDISGIFHGPLFYYLSAVPFAITKGNPIFVSAFLVLLQSLTVIPIYLLGKKLFNKRVGILSGVLFSVSFAAIVYARWLSNPPLSIPLVTLFFFFLYRFIKGEKNYLLWASITFGLAAQVQFLNLIFLTLTLSTFLVIYRKKFLSHKIFTMASLLLAAVVSIGTFILFDLRHGFLIIKNVFELINGGKGYYSSYFDTAQNALQIFITFFANTIIPGGFIGTIIFLVVGGIFLQREFKKGKSKHNDVFLFLLVWLFLPLLVLLFLRHSVLDHYFLFSLPAIVLFVGFTLDQFWAKKKFFGVILLALTVLINIIAWISNIPQNEKIFFQATQPQLKFSDQRKVIDEIYKRASGEVFSFQAYTIPYWSQEGWEYLFWYYGKEKYGYEPIEEKAKKLFVIIQDDPSSKTFQESWLGDTVSKWGKETSNFRYGILTILELQVEQ